MFVIEGGGSFEKELEGQLFVRLKSPAGKVNVEVLVKSEIPFGDWTDGPSLFRERGKAAPPDLPLYLETVRNVEAWIWALMALPGAVILCYIAKVLFFHPVREPLRTAIPVEAVAKFLNAGGKTKIE
jgi:hypothetical protein